MINKINLMLAHYDLSVNLNISSHNILKTYNIRKLERNFNFKIENKVSFYFYIAPFSRKTCYIQYIK